MEAPRPRWSPRTKSIVSFALLALGIFLLYRFSAVLTPLVLAAILAYVVSPLAGIFEAKLHLNRILATLCAYLILLVLLIAIPMLLIPPLAAQSADLEQNLLRLMDQAEAFLGKRYIIFGQTIDTTSAFQQIVDAVQSLIAPIFGQTLTLALEVITSLVWVIFILVVSFYLIKDGPQVRIWVTRHIHPDYQEDFNLLLAEINQIWSAFFRGQLVLATVVAIGFSIIGLALGIPFALAMGVLAGLLEFLPSIGHGIWLSLAVILALFAGSTWIPIPNWAFALVLVALHIVYQQFDLNYLIPRIIGRSVHLPPLVVILGIVAGAVSVGVLGIFLAAPTIATARVVGRYVFANLFDFEPLSSSVSQPLPAPNPRWWRRPAPPQT